MNRLDIEKFVDFTNSQEDLSETLMSYAKATSLLAGLFQSRKLFQGLVVGLLTAGMYLYREWLLAHGAKEIEGIEQRMAKQPKSYLN